MTDDQHAVQVTDLQVIDRYDALGIPHPDPATMCQAECEGTGFVPVWFPEGVKVNSIIPVASIAPTPEDYAKYHDLWLAAERENPADDGWHFVRCPDCQGTGKRPPATA